MPEERTVSHLVVVGSSAGGVEALLSLVATLDSDFPAPIVFAQHLDPARESHLGEILSRRSILPVRTVDHRTPLENGVVFVVAANQNVGISDHELWLDEAAGGRSKPSIDLLFNTAATVFGEHLIAVVLTGTGSDGSAGARRVKEMGGTVVIQNPTTASFGGMPRSLAPNTVDIVTELENIAPLLKDLLAREDKPLQNEEALLREFLTKIRQHSGIDFSSYKTPTIQRRLHRRMVATGWQRLQDYLTYTERTPAEYQRLINSFLIKVTEFFRDPELFKYLQEILLPQLVEEARQRGNQLRLWSAGCSTGEEAYTLAILVSEALGDELDDFSVRIFATDLDREAIAFGRRGIYPANSLSNMPPQYIEKYFTKTDDSYELSKSARGLVIFGEHDLGQRAPFPHIDLVLCRNVLMYFVQELQKRALELFAYSLRDHGYLILGKAETSSAVPGLFQPANPGLKVYQRQGEQRLPPSIGGENAFRTQRLHTHRPVGEAASESRGQRSVEVSIDASQAEMLMDLPVGVVVMDKRYDIEAINSLARRLLGIQTEAIGEDFLHLLQNIPTKPLRSMIDAALRGEAPAAIEELQVEIAALGETRFLQILCSPRRAHTIERHVTGAVLVVNDVTLAVIQRRTNEGIESRRNHERDKAERERNQVTARQEKLTEELTSSNRELLDANEQLTNVIVALRKANEEFMLGNEETQAATEEMETLNEELQATNEELETLNEELQATIEELNTTNDDLTARGTELLDLSESLEDQRRRLSTILINMGEAVMVLDQHGRLVLTSDIFNQMFAGAGVKFIAEDENGERLPSSETPQAKAARGEVFQMDFTQTDSEGNRHWFEARGQPINPDSAGSDSVMVIRDVTDRGLLQLQDEFMAMASHELRTPLTALQGYLEMMVRRLDASLSNAQVKSYAANALSQTKRLGSLVRDLTDVSRLRTGKLSYQREHVDLVPLVQHVIDTTETLSHSAEIHADLQHEPLMVFGDRARLEQVVLNLLTNAISHAPNASVIDVAVLLNNDMAEISVHDTGPGIPEEHRPRVFSRFYQVAREDQYRAGGLGLGLFLVRTIVTEHGGTVDFTSEIGAGTTFTVNLPIADDANPEAEQSEFPADVPG
ncbi:MAG: hypothetical protein JWO42_1913 [Chloroflexi bacterium]|nr:hypothetical protein [Chloroflexota bacterium]